CPLTTYGENCTEFCSSKCLNELCHHKSGRCDQCQTGYFGYFCDLKCRSRRYGDGCNRTCDANCLDLLCDHVTGKCDQCVDGKDGEYCQRTATKRSNDEAVIIGTVVGVILGLLIIFTILAVYMYRNYSFNRKRKQSVASTRTESGPGIGSVLELSSLGKNPAVHISAGPRHSKGQVHTITEEDGNLDNTYANVAKESTAVKVEDLKSYIQQHSNDNFLMDQFQSVPLASKYSRLNAHDPWNAKKNRYKNILPDDYTRVCLKVYNEYEDYINANHIKDYHNKKAYIAAQAPKENTLNDFVRMLWEQEVERIVMLTNLVEGKKIKSAKYWNDQEPKTFDKVTVELKSTKIYAEYTVRHMTLSESGSSTRDLIQFHFTAWLDKSVPESPWGLVELYQRIMADLGSGPLLVHCSAGVGRTGTFIALCILLQEAEATGNMDFLHLLWKLRQQRMSMIQTIEQYEFLHKLALTAYLVAGTSISAKNIPNKLLALEETQPSSNLSGYSKEFQAISKAHFHDVEDSNIGAEDSDNVYQNSRVASMKDKNRAKSILPNDSYRPVLACENKSLGKYINAVLVPSLTSTRQDILTQLPLPSTVTDFWRLVTQYNVGLVVAFETDSWKSDETVGKFLPDSESEPITTDLFEIQAKLTAESSGCHELLITGEHHLTCLLCKTPGTDPKTALDIHKKIKYWRPELPLRTLFMCRNGADQSGLMCVQSILLDKLEVDKCLAVPLVVGAIKVIRPQVIPTEDQYKYLYAVLKLAQDSKGTETTSDIVATTDLQDVEYCNTGSVESLGIVADTRPRTEPAPDLDNLPPSLYSNQENCSHAQDGCNVEKTPDIVGSVDSPNVEYCNVESVESLGIAAGTVPQTEPDQEQSLA
ncbi:receptor-type tyrosine-protein phosphatase alpha-like, partial [Elysia marginata]